jgi:hypothetical protein
MATSLAPIVLFVYNRPSHTQRTLEALAINTLAEKSELYIYADGMRSNASEQQKEQVMAVRQIIRQHQWCGKVHLIEQTENKGLADSIANGVTEIVNRYGKVIVLEDDIVTSPQFLEYMNNALVRYENDEKVMHVSGYMFPITSDFGDKTNTFFSQLMMCWGWATWKRAWNFFSRNAADVNQKLIQSGKIQVFDYDNSGVFYSQIQRNLENSLKTWAIFWYASIFLNDGLCLMPRISFVQNVGMDNSGENSEQTNIYYNMVLCHNPTIDMLPLEKDEHMETKIQLFYKYYKNITILNHKKIVLKNKIKNIFFNIKQRILKLFK